MKIEKNRNQRSKACREKSAEVIVVKLSISFMKD